MFWNRKNSEIKKFPEMSNGIPVFVRFISPSGVNLSQIFTVPTGKYLLLMAGSIYNNQVATLAALDYIPNGIPDLPVILNGFTPGGVQFLSIDNANLGSTTLAILQRTVVIPERSIIRLLTNIAGGTTANNWFVVLFGLLFDNETPLP